MSDLSPTPTPSFAVGQDVVVRWPNPVPHDDHGRVLDCNEHMVIVQFPADLPLGRCFYARPEGGWISEEHQPVTISAKEPQHG